MLAFVLAVAVVLLEVATVLSTTVLNPAFVSSELAGIELHPLVAEEVKKQLPPEGLFIVDIIDEVAPELEVWMHEQASTIVSAVDAYLEGDEEFRAVVSLVEPKAVLAVHVEATIRDLGVPQLPGLPALAEDMVLDLVLEQMNRRIPDLLVVDEALLDAPTVGMLRQVRQYVWYVNLSLKMLPIVCILSVLLIAGLCLWRLRLAARYVGVALCVAGIAALAAAGLARIYLPRAIPDAIPAQYVAFAPGFIADWCRLLFLYATATLTAGAVVLLVVLWQESRGRTGG